MEQKLEAAISEGLHPSDHLETPPTRFFSGAKDPWFKLSNLYACTVRVGDHTFPSAEHAYQALHKIPDCNLEPWLQGGIYSNWKHVYRVLEKPFDPKKKNKWQKKDQIGILAILVVRNADKFGVRFKDRDDALSISYERRWRPIFEAKYSNAELRAILLGTRSTLIEFKRGGHKDMLEAFRNARKAGASIEVANQAAQRAELWGAFNYGAPTERKKGVSDVADSLQMTVWGQNVTGKNLTRYRNELLVLERESAQKRSADDSDSNEGEAAKSSKKQRKSN